MRNPALGTAGGIRYAVVPGLHGIRGRAAGTCETIIIRIIRIIAVTGAAEFSDPADGLRRGRCRRRRIFRNDDGEDGRHGLLLIIIDFQR